MVGSDDDFSEAPVSIGEARAQRTKGGADIWSVREMLVAVLRDIDSGRINPTHAGLVLATETEEGTTMEYFQKCQSTLQLVGMHFRAAKELA
jgi:hypothetical protein